MTNDYEGVIIKQELHLTKYERNKMHFNIHIIRVRKIFFYFIKAFKLIILRQNAERIR